MSLFVKICGVTRVEDVLVAVAAGASAIGINLWPGSKRCVALSSARALLEAIPVGVTRIAVFVNAEVGELCEALAAGFELVQLHGDESPAIAAGPALRGRCVRAHRVRGAESVARSALAAWEGEGPFQLLDAPAPGYGGGGQVFDWGLARSAASSFQLLLAGGLTPGNVADAVTSVRPFGVDVASGVESAPGIKDPELVRSFIQAARTAWERLERTE